MRFITVPILIVLLLTQTFSKWVLIMQYEINKKYITERLCENRNRPLLHCNGNCQLMQKMRAEEKEQAPANSGSIPKYNFGEIIDPPGSASPADISSHITPTPKKGFYLLKDYSAHLPGIFRPPLA